MNNDLISREALKEKWKEECCGCCENCSHCMTGLNCELIDNAPTVEYTFEEAFQKTVCENRLYCPIRPKGEWNYIQSGMCVCPFCGAMPHKLYKNFCAKCGADMRGGAE